MGAYRCVGYTNKWEASKTYGGVQTYRGHPNIWQCPNIWGNQNIWGPYKYMGASKYIGDVQTYGQHPFSFISKSNFSDMLKFMF